jgi:hypothetical protein
VVNCAPPLSAPAQPRESPILDEAELFPFGRHDDQIDAASLALSKLAAWPGAPASLPELLVWGKQNDFGPAVFPGRLGAQGYGGEVGMGNGRRDPFWS